MPKKWFRISFADKAFLRLLAEKGLAVEALDIETGIAVMTEFWEQHGAQHTRGDGGEDELLITRRPSVAITRRMVRDGGDQQAYELTLSFESGEPRLEFGPA